MQSIRFDKVKFGIQVVVDNKNFGFISQTLGFQVTVISETDPVFVKDSNVFELIRKK